MAWVRQAKPPAHTCGLPGLSMPFAPRIVYGAGTLGDLWRCDDCGKLWRLAHACDMCDAYGRGSHRGQCTLGNRWRDAWMWQRLRSWITSRRSSA